MDVSEVVLKPEKVISHLDKSSWELVNKLLVRKILSEFSHERILQPIMEKKMEGWDYFRVEADDPFIYYTFKARILALNHWCIQINSIQKFFKNDQQPIDAVNFILEFRNKIGVSEEVLPSYLEEIISTLNGSAFKFVNKRISSKTLAFSHFQHVERSMTEGHPAFIANNGRIGFDAFDYLEFAPEAGQLFQIIWLAGKKDRTVYAGIKALSYQQLIVQELGNETLNIFNNIIYDKGCIPEDYILIPVHPWQWCNKISTIFSPELASKNLIYLGKSPDLYQAQQSIRTLYNTSHPEKFYTKTSLSILNMGFLRGLPVYYLGTAPEMAEWLEKLLGGDPYLHETGFKMLREVASVSYINTYYEEFGKHHPSNKMLASLWRESPLTYTEPHQNLITMAAFLHVDQEGVALLPQIIAESGLTVTDWLGKYFKAYLSPLLHCFYNYDLVFMPHGENLIIVLEKHVPVKALLKDITEEAVILNPEVVLPENLKRMYAKVPEDVKLLSVFIDVFDGFFRFMSAIIAEHMQYPEDIFWKEVASCINEYQQSHPHLKEKFEKYNLFDSGFSLSCLNRLQINNNKTMIDLEDPVALLQFHGKLQNPIAAYKIV